MRRYQTTKLETKPGFSLFGTKLWDGEGVGCSAKGLIATLIIIQDGRWPAFSGNVNHSTRSSTIRSTLLVKDKNNKPLTITSVQKDINKAFRYFPRSEPMSMPRMSTDSGSEFARRLD